MEIFLRLLVRLIAFVGCGFIMLAGERLFPKEFSNHWYVALPIFGIALLWLFGIGYLAANYRRK